MPMISMFEAAERLGVSEKSVRRFIAAGRLTGYRIGPRLIRVDRDEVEALLQRIPTTHPEGGDGGHAA
jgi:excisionase family DNA binding protein